MTEAQIGTLLATVLGAVLAGVGYVTKLLLEESRERRKERARKLARLQQLDSLLIASKYAATVQQDLARRLIQNVHARGHELPARPGYERAMVALRPHFNEDDHDLHRIIRSYTEHALLPLNKAMSAWLRDDTDYRVHIRPGTDARAKVATDLAAKLTQLDTHLLLWLAKYAAWIVDQPQHAIVYLADEEEHGVGFPRGIDGVVKAALAVAAGPTAGQTAATLTPPP